MGVPVHLFGGGVEGSVEMGIWLEVMCLGCVKDRGRGPSGGMGGMSCELPCKALTDPHADIPEWSADASPVPERLDEAYARPPAVCMAYVPRKKRSDAGARRPRPVTGMEPLFEAAS
jgi:hypothetical protein